MKRIVLSSALLFALTPFGAAHAQNAASIVTSVTSDVTTRVVSDAVRETTREALQSGQKGGEAAAADTKTQAKKADAAAKAPKK